MESQNNMYMIEDDRGQKNRIYFYARKVDIIKCKVYILKAEIKMKIGSLFYVEIGHKK